LQELEKAWRPYVETCIAARALSRSPRPLSMAPSRPSSATNAGYRFIET
jgi:hypothetical protein